MKHKETFYTSDRNEWRQWLSENFETKTEIWFVFPTKDSGEAALSYIDAARKRPEEFRKRLDIFLAKTRANKLITGFGGIDKYY